MRSGHSKIVVATDVAARGLDVERITHVINYDLPMQADIYLHRIGRTGRAGRAGVALIFVTPRERRRLAEIEKFTGQSMRAMAIPTNADIAKRRTTELELRITSQLECNDLDRYRELIEAMLEKRKGELDPLVLAAAIARLAAGDKPLVLSEAEPEPAAAGKHRKDEQMVRLFLGVGFRAGMRPGTLVGAITNQAKVPGTAIGAIDIRESTTFFTLDSRYVSDVMRRMAKVTIRGRPALIRYARPERDQDRQGARNGKRRSFYRAKNRR